MAGKRVVLHVGTMKSGTTFVQWLLQHRRQDLHRVGVHALAASGKQSPRQGRPHLAAIDLHRTGATGPKWERIVRTVEQSKWETVVISSEFLSFLGPDTVDAAVRRLAGHEVTVLLTVRDQVGVIPAQWQSFTRNRGQATFASYVRQISDTENQHTKSYRSFHRAQDVPEIVANWDRPGVDRIVTMSVPISGSTPELMWRRFSEAAGIPTTEISFEGVTRNPSIGYPACDCVRRLNRHLEDLPQPTYRRLVRPLARAVLEPLRDGQARPEVDRGTALLAVERNRAIRDLAGAGRVRHVGDPADLPVEVDLEQFPEEIAPPDPGQVDETAAAMHRFVAERVGATGAPPRGRRRLLAETARLLREGSDA